MLILLTRWAKFKSEHSCFGKDVLQENSDKLLAGMLIGRIILGNNLALFCTVECDSNLWSPNSILWFILQTLFCLCNGRYIAHNRKKKKTRQKQYVHEQENGEIKHDSQSMKDYTTVKMNELQLHKTIQMKFRNIMLSELKLLYVIFF